MICVKCHRELKFDGVWFHAARPETPHVPRPQYLTAEDRAAWRGRVRRERNRTRTAAFEALQWCRKLYPWRVRAAESRMSAQRIQNAAPPGVRIATGLFEALNS
jgi:hypothetical protein